MTRDEHRAKCIKAIAYVLCDHYGNHPEDAFCFDEWQTGAIAVFDALNGIARVNPIEATEEMIEAGELAAGAKWSGHPVVFIFSAMSAAGNLTNDPDAGLPTAADVRGILKPEEKP